MKIVTAGQRGNVATGDEIRGARNNRRRMLSYSLVLLFSVLGAAQGAKFCKIDLPISGYNRTINGTGNAGAFYGNDKGGHLVEGVWSYNPNGDQCGCRITSRGSGNTVILGNIFQGFSNDVCGQMCGLVLYAGSNGSHWENMLM